MNNRRRLIGFVISNKMQKTVVVDVTRTYRHRLYKKTVSDHTHFKAHDEIGCQVGDQVRIVESRPLSRQKRWVVEEILRRGEESGGSSDEVEKESEE